MTEKEFRDTLARVMNVTDRRESLYSIFDRFNLLSKKERHVLMTEVSPAFNIALHPFSGKYETKILCKCEGTRHVYYFDGEVLQFKGGIAGYDEEGTLESIKEDVTGEVIHFQHRVRT